MKRTTHLLIALLALLAAPAFAAKKEAKETSKKVEVKKEDSKKEEAKATPVATAEPTKEATKEPAKEDGEERAAKAEASHKSAGLAITLAIIPGIAVHGAGHMYAGSWIKGLGLFVIGTGGGILAYDQAMSGYSDIEKLMNSNNGNIPQDLSGAYKRVGLILVGAMAFIWTGWDDISGSAIAVGEYNKRADEAARTQSGIQFLPRYDGAALAYTKKF